MLRYIIKMIYITFDASIIVETLKTATYDTHTVYNSIKYYSHLQIHIFIDK